MIFPSPLNRLKKTRVVPSALIRPIPVKTETRANLRAALESIVLLVVSIGTGTAAQPTLMTRFVAGDDPVYSISFSPDGKTLTSAGWDKSIRIWDVGKQAIVRSLKGHTDHINSVSFGPNGKILVSASDDGTIRLWDVETERTTAVVEAGGRVSRVAFAPDGKTIASIGGKPNIKLWDASTLKNTITITTMGPEEANATLSVAYSPDGKVARVRQRGSLYQALGRCHGEIPAEHKRSPKHHSIACIRPQR